MEWAPNLRTLSLLLLLQCLTEMLHMTTDRRVSGRFKHQCDCSMVTAKVTIRFAVLLVCRSAVIPWDVVLT